MTDKLDYKKACEDALNSMDEEFEKGAKAMLSNLRREVTCCDGKDGCAICISGNKFLRELSKRISSTHRKKN